MLKRKVFDGRSNPQPKRRLTEEQMERIRRNKHLAKLRRQVSKWDFTFSFSREVLEIVEE